MPIHATAQVTIQATGGIAEGPRHRFVELRRSADDAGGVRISADNPLYAEIVKLFARVV